MSRQLSFRPAPRPVEQVARVIVTLPDGTERRARIAPVPPSGVAMWVDGVALGMSAGSPIEGFEAFTAADLAVRPVAADTPEQAEASARVLDQWREAVSRALGVRAATARWQAEQRAERDRQAAAFAAAATARNAICAHSPPGHPGIRCDRPAGHSELHMTTISTDGISRRALWDDAGRVPDRPDAGIESDWIGTGPTRCGHVGPASVGGRTCTLDRGHDGDHGASYVGGGIAGRLTWPAEAEK